MLPVSTKTAKEPYIKVLPSTAKKIAAELAAFWGLKIRVRHDSNL